MLGLPNCDNKRLIRLLEFAETISELSISLNDEMIYEINHQVTYAVMNAIYAIAYIEA